MKRFVSILVFVFSLLAVFPVYATESFLDKDADWWRTATPEIVEQMIKNGAVVKQKYESGGTILMDAASESTNPRVIEMLIKYGADVNAKDKSYDTVLIYAVANNTNPAVIETLIKHGADVNAKNKDEFTALMSAVIYNSNVEIVKTLIKHGADVKAKDENGFPVIMHAVKRDPNSPVIETLIGTKKILFIFNGLCIFTAHFSYSHNIHITLDISNLSVYRFHNFFTV